MTSMEDIKKELGEYLLNKKLLAEKEKDLDELIAKAEKVTTELSDMPKGSPIVQDRMAEFSVMIVDLKNERLGQLIQMYKSKKRIEDNIDKLDQPYRDLLYFRYIRGHDLTQVANDINYNYTYTCDLHGKALLMYKRTEEI